jgi:hypothetical protein
MSGPIFARLMAATNRFAVLSSCTALLALACSGRPPSAPSPSLPAADSPRVELTTLQDRNWGVVRSAALGLKLALPEARAWLSEPEPAPAGAPWDLRHEPTGSSLSVRRWRSSRLPRVDSCEAELRERTKDLLSADETNLVARRSVRIPEGFVTQITLLAVPSRDGAVRGEVLAVGAGVGECLALVARTECATEAELGERLRLLDIAVGHLRLMHIEDRVPAPAAPHGAR